MPSGHVAHFDLQVPSLQLGGPKRRRKLVAEEDEAPTVFHVDMTRKSPASAVAFLNMMYGIPLASKPTPTINEITYAPFVVRFKTCCCSYSLFHNISEGMRSSRNHETLVLLVPDKSIDTSW